MRVEKTGAATAPIENIVASAAPDGASFAEALHTASGKTDLDAIFDDAAQRYDIPVNLLKAVAQAESSVNPNAVSKCGAVGVMQLMPATARALGVTDSYDPAQNIMGGAKYLREMLDAFDGDTGLALAAYNAGPGAVRKYGGVPPYAETQAYVQKVTALSGGVLTAGSVRSAAGGAAGYTLSTGASGVERSLAEMYLMKILEMQMNLPGVGEERET
ncbi:MAG: lytic transglycosylase domain-containing protein [Oscillospiraceae bacterium]|jgi:soluble lytic murein transglycosylase-like protein|nr:lytic transglycosylase domain-containing protein [Oscillospiraceae bacterium]